MFRSRLARVIVPLLLVLPAASDPPSRDDPAEPTLPARAESGPSRPLLLINQPLDRDLWVLARERDACRSHIIYQHNGDPHETGTIDLDDLGRGIRRTVPRNFDGYAVLDFEHPYFTRLRLAPDSPQFQDAQAQLVKAIRHAKRLRPNAKWSVWGLPRIRYSFYDDESQAMVRAPALILAELDFLCPSIYDRHPDAEDPKWATRDRRFIGEVMRLSLEIADGRPVLPYIWHRYGKTDRSFSKPNLWPVSDGELRNLVTWPLEDGADGILWWGADDFHLKLFEKPPEPGEEIFGDHPSLWGRYVRLQAMYADVKPESMLLKDHLHDLHAHVIEVLADTIDEFVRRREESQAGDGG